MSVPLDEMKWDMNQRAATLIGRRSRREMRMIWTCFTLLAVFSAFGLAVGQGTVGDPAAAPQDEAPEATQKVEASANAKADPDPDTKPAAADENPILDAFTGGGAGGEPEAEAVVKPAAGEPIVAKLKAFASSCDLELRLGASLEKSKRLALPFADAAGGEFIEKFTAANGLVWFAKDRLLYVSEREDHRSALVPVDLEFGQPVIQRLVDQRALRDLGGGKYGIGSNQVQFMETPHAFVTGHIEFVRFIKERFGIQTGAIANTESGGLGIDLESDQSENPESGASGDAATGWDGDGAEPESGGLTLLGPDNRPTATIAEFVGEGRSFVESSSLPEARADSTITSKGAMAVRAFRFEHAWVATVTLDATGTNKIVAPGIFNLFTKLCGQVRNEPFSSTNVTTTTAESAQIGDALRQAESASIGDFDNLFDLRSKQLAAESLLGRPLIANSFTETASLDKRGAAARNLSDVADDVLFPGEGINGPPPVEKLLPAGVRPLDVRAAIPQQLGASPEENRGTSGVSYTIGQESGLLKQGVVPADLPTLHAGVVADPTTNTIIVCDEARFMESYEEIHRKLDQPQCLVEISAVIIDINVDSVLSFSTKYGGFGTKQLGSETRLSGRGRFNGGLFKSGATDTGFPGGMLGLFDPDFAVADNPLTVAAQVIGSSGQLNARFQALQSDGKAKILARPTLLTIDGAKAVFSDNDSVFVEAPGEHNADLYRVNAPLAFEVTPRTLGGSNEELKLVVKITDSAGKPQQTTENVPLVGESLIDTSAIVGQGQSLLIGGRFRTEQVEDERSIPILGRIPVLGLAFKDKGVRNARFQRLFLITPRIIDPMTLRPIPDAAANTSAQRSK